MNVKLNAILGLLLCASSTVALAGNKNPCDVDCVDARIAKALSAIKLPIGSYTSDSWISACPTGATGLQNGCLINAASAANSPIGGLINLMFNAFNTSPSSVANSVFIRKFSPGYVFTPNNQTVTFDGTGVPATTNLACENFYESGIVPDDPIVNDPTALFANAYSLFFDPTVFSGGLVRTLSILTAAPGGNANNLAIPIYAICVGLNAVPGSDGGPVSLSGVVVS